MAAAVAVAVKPAAVGERKIVRHMALQAKNATATLLRSDNT